MPAIVAGSTAASRIASPSAGCGSTTPSPRPCFRSSSLERSQRLWPPRRRPPTEQDQVRAALLRDLEATRYAAERAFRQYDAADPANRLVAGELEARWNTALGRVAEVESKIATHGVATPVRTHKTPSSFAALAGNLEAIWSAPTADARLKKRIVRTVIQEVVADIDDDAAEVILVIHWMGGIHTEIRLPRRRGRRNSTSPDIIAAVRLLVRIANDDLIAGILNRNKLVTGHGNRWTRERVTALRSHHHIPAWRPAADGIEPWLNLTRAAELPRHRPEDAAARRRQRGDRRRPPASRRSMDLPSCRPRRTNGADDRSTGRARARATPRDLIPNNRTYSLQ